MKPFDSLKFDYTYCDTKKCIHRYGCKRWIGNYEIIDDISQCWLLEADECIDDNFVMIDRFRASNKRNR